MVELCLLGIDGGLNDIIVRVSDQDAAKEVCIEFSVTDRLIAVYDVLHVLVSFYFIQIYKFVFTYLTLVCRLIRIIIYFISKNSYICRCSRQRTYIDIRKRLLYLCFLEFRHSKDCSTMNKVAFTWLFVASWTLLIVRATRSSKTSRSGQWKKSTFLCVPFPYTLSESFMKMEPHKVYQQMKDDDLLKSVISNNHEAIVYFFYQKYLPTFQYHIYNIFPYKVDVQDLVDEFFLYLFENQWRRLRTFNGKASLNTWISVISYRFFKQYKVSKIDSNGIISINSQWESFTGEWIQSQNVGIKMDIEKAIGAIESERDKEIARLIFYEDREFKEIADKYGLSVDYVYTIKNRIGKHLKRMLDCYN